MYNYDDEYNWEQRPARRRKNTMATAAVVLGILSICLCSVFYVSLPCGAMAVICAILSRDSRPMTGKSRAGMICGVIGMVITVVLTVSAFRYVLTTDDGREYLQYYYRMYTGDYDFDIDDAFKELFPFLYDSEGTDPNGSEGNDSDDGSDAGTDDGTGNEGYGFDHGDSGNDAEDGGGSNSSDSNWEGGFI